MRCGCNPDQIVRLNSTAKLSYIFHMKKISVPYLPPLDFEGLLKNYELHRIGNLEWFEKGRLQRVICIKGSVGTISVENDSLNSCLLVTIDFPDESAFPEIILRVRNLFDLDIDPAFIAHQLGRAPDLKKIHDLHPGIRTPSGWEPFEVAVNTILGQLVSMENARKLVHDLIELTGEDSGLEINGHKIKLFPTPEKLLASDLTTFKTTNMRKQTLKNFSQAIVDGNISLDSEQDVEAFISKALAIKGIGPWTAHYMALKVLRNTDSFPASDLILARTLEFHSKEIIDSMQPWRGYVAALFWRVYSEKLTKKKTVNQIAQ
jgi:AraC family transcriptional regulator of adaptative response / DNA-3-methyladenine glycosylase II